MAQIEGILIPADNVVRLRGGKAEQARSGRGGQTIGADAPKSPP
jgi:hypothetical protein